MMNNSKNIQKLLNSCDSKFCIIEENKQDHKFEIVKFNNLKIMIEYLKNIFEKNLKKSNFHSAYHNQKLLKIDQQTLSKTRILI